MENVSKALIIAGGVLIGVLIVTLAIILYATFSETASFAERQIETDRINQFNSQFSVYVYKTLDIYDVIKIASIANESNIKNGLQGPMKADENSLYVQVNANLDKNYYNLETELENKNNWLQSNINNVNYTCTVEYSEKTGRVNLVEIKKKQQ